MDRTRVLVVHPSAYDLTPEGLYYFRNFLCALNDATRSGDVSIQIAVTPNRVDDYVNALHRGGHR